MTTWMAGLCRVGQVIRRPAYVEFRGADVVVQAGGHDGIVGAVELLVHLVRVVEQQQRMARIELRVRQAAIVPRTGEHDDNVAKLCRLNLSC